MNRKERCESQGKGLRLQGEVCCHMGRFEITRGRSVTTKGNVLGCRGEVRDYKGKACDYNRKCVTTAQDLRLPGKFWDYKERFVITIKFVIRTDGV